MKRFIKITIWTILILVVISLILYFRPAWTPSIRSENGVTSVASLETIILGNCKQKVLIRSKNTTHPILLFVHGGPGMPLMYLAHTFQRSLEKKFTVVQWDQRGAGKSYDPNIPINTINVEQYLSDAIQLIDTLRRRYHQPKVFLVGHSWGTYLSSILVQRHPELFYAYISVGQVVDGVEAAKIQRSFLLNEAKAHSDTGLLRRLSDSNFSSYENWIFKYGGELKHSTSYLPLVLSGLQASEYTFRDVLNVAKGPKFCGRYMNYNAIKGTIMSDVKRYDVPVFFMVGAHDYTTPFPLIKKYYDLLTAPKKEIVWFNESAHFPFYEEPEKFDSIMLTEVLDIANKR